MIYTTSKETPREGTRPTGHCTGPLTRLPGCMTPCLIKHPHQNPGSGFILVAILVIVMLGSMVAMSLLFRLQAEEHASSAGADSEQAWLAAMSGVEEAFRMAAAAKP